MSDFIELYKAQTAVTPELLATLFWNMDSDQQAKFFAALERISGGAKLCMQMAHVVQSIADMADMADKGDKDGQDAQNGFQTMLAHAQDYVASAIAYRHFKARQAIKGYATGSQS